MTAVLLKGEELEVARARSKRCAPPSATAPTRTSSEGLLEALADGSELEGRHAAELDRLLTLALQTGRVRALYGPGGEQAALRAFRKLPSGTELAQGAPR